MMRGRILITGGSGTLGHAILHKALREGWDAEFTVLARSELKLSMMRRRWPRLRTVVGDVRDPDCLAAAVAGHDGVIHAAAMKRIPECEEQPRECYLTNVIGSENVARACFDTVKWVVAISTDKACQATTTYGSSKLMMESIFQAYGRKISGTVYRLVRYGNVVASNGSVVPLWREQYKASKPLTITDVRMTRFWMSPIDAVQAIEDAVFVSDYQESVGMYVPKVASCPMTMLAAHLFPNCEFREIGLRSNEKLHESLVSFDEIAREYKDHFRVGAHGDRGHTYSSSHATPLRMGDFDRMLREAEFLEQLGV